MNPRSGYRKSIFDEEFKFQYESGDPHIHIATQNVILKFLVSFTKKVLPKRFAKVTRCIAMGIK